MLVPTMMSTGMCFASSTLSTPIWADPLAPPPLSTRAILGRSILVAPGFLAEGAGSLAPAAAMNGRVASRSTSRWVHPR